MAICTGQPAVPIMYLRPTRASFDNPESALDGGVNGLGEAISIETSGGGIVTATYEECVLLGDDTERHEIINWLGARGNGGYRFFNVPILNDGIGPFLFIDGKRRPIIKGIPHSDGSFFCDAVHTHFQYSGSECRCFCHFAVDGRLAVSGTHDFLRNVAARKRRRRSCGGLSRHIQHGRRRERYFSRGQAA